MTPSDLRRQAPGSLPLSPGGLARAFSEYILPALWLAALAAAYLAVIGGAFVTAAWLWGAL